MLRLVSKWWSGKSSVKPVTAGIPTDSSVKPVSLVNERLEDVWGSDRQVWGLGSPTFLVLAHHAGSSDRGVFALNPWFVPAQLRGDYLRVVDAGLPEPVSLSDAALVAWAPYSASPGTDAFPEWITGHSFIDDSGCYLGTDAFRQHVAILLTVTGWGVEVLSSALSPSEGGLPLMNFVPLVNQQEGK